jgi:FixJ family two-component response regulator
MMVRANQKLIGWSPEVGDRSNPVHSIQTSGPETGRRLIGVVDDDESVRNALSSFFRSLGLSCAVFPSSEAFLDSGRLNETDCVILDVRLPGDSGLDLHQRLQEMHKRIPVIFVSGNPDADVCRKALEQGALAFLGKPFPEDRMLAALRSALKTD